MSQLMLGAVGFSLLVQPRKWTAARIIEHGCFNELYLHNWIISIWGFIHVLLPKVLEI